MSDAPVLFLALDDGAMVPASPYWSRKASEQYKPGTRYELVENEQRSMASHRSYFASINEAWQNLPDYLLEEYPSAEHLRKKLLIRTGFAHERHIVCSSKAECLRIAAFVSQFDAYAIVIARGNALHVYTAESQSTKAMGKERFQASKEAVLNRVASLIGTTPRELEKQGEAA